jgi:D-alanyl-D-alanine dipeptidase
VKWNENLCTENNNHVVVGKDAYMLSADGALLAAAMARRGFKPYDKEWWHFTLVREPYPATYFDFPVR